MNRSALGLVLAFVAGTACAYMRADHDAAWVDSRVAAWQPTEKERSWERIGWAGGLLEAERLAKQNRRPVFLFTHDGRLNIGRC